MKILWVKTDFLHPTTRGGQIRTLEMLRRLHSRNEIHYVAFEDRAQPEGLEGSSQYCSRAYPVAHKPPSRRSLKFAGQLARGLWSKEPVSIARYRSAEMSDLIDRLRQTERFDRIVCDFLTPAVNLRDLTNVTLFQHNVETVIWQRHAGTVGNPFGRHYLRRQAELMGAFEARICRAVDDVVAVSASDAALMRKLYGVTRVAEIPTGVDLDFFTPSQPAARVADLTFVGSMDWLPNIDGMRFFVADVLPLIRQSRPDCTVAVVGRSPGGEILRMAERDKNIQVTGTVPDVRPYLWGSAVSVVPLRIGGGTRLKIYEAMAARVPVVSTTIGAEGLDVRSPDHILIGDTAADFARHCVTLLQDAAARERLASNAWSLVAAKFSWDSVARSFESILAKSPQAGRSSSSA